MTDMDLTKFDEYARSLGGLNEALENATTNVLRLHVDLDEIRRIAELDDSGKKKCVAKFKVLVTLLENHQVIVGRYQQELASFRNDVDYVVRR